MYKPFLLMKELKLREKLLILYIVSIPFMKTLPLPVLAEKLQFSELIFLGILICSFKDLPKIINQSFCKLELKIFYLFLAVSLFSLIRKNLLLSGVVEYVGIVYLFLLFILFVYLLDNNHLFLYLIKTWVVISASVAFLGILSLCFYYFADKNLAAPFIFTQEQMSSVMWFPRVISTFRNPNMFLTYLHISLGLALYLLITAKKTFNRFFLSLAVILLSAAIVFTGSRLILGIIFTLFIIAIFFKDRHPLWSALSYLFGFLFICVLILTLLFTRWTIYPANIECSDKTKQCKASFTFADSFYYMQNSAALKMIKARPFRGVGLGGYFYEFPNYTDWDKYEATLSVERSNGRFNSDAHSTYLGICAETGIFGLSALLIFIYFIFGNILLNLKLSENRTNFRALFVIFFALISGFLLNGFLIDVISMRHFWVFLSLVISGNNINKREETFLD